MGRNATTFTRRRPEVHIWIAALKQANLRRRRLEFSILLKIILISSFTFPVFIYLAEVHKFQNFFLLFLFLPCDLQDRKRESLRKTGNKTSHHQQRNYKHYKKKKKAETLAYPHMIPSSVPFVLIVQDHIFKTFTREDLL